MKQFLFRRKKLILDLFCENDPLDGLTAPDKASNFIPKWWLQLEREVEVSWSMKPASTMRRCPGFLDYFSNSVVLPMWCDFVIDVGAAGTTEYQYQFADNTSFAQEHQSWQRGDFLPDTKYQHLKIKSPWAARTKEDVNWVVTQPIWCFTTPESVFVPPAVLNFKYQRGTHVNMFIPRKENEAHRLDIPAGHPLMALTPMTDRPVELRRQIVDAEEFRKITKEYKYFFCNNYVKTAR
jgi:hypothetical protein